MRKKLFAEMRLNKTAMAIICGGKKKDKEKDKEHDNNGLAVGNPHNPEPVLYLSSPVPDNQDILT